MLHYPHYLTNHSFKEDRNNSTTSRRAGGRLLETIRGSSQTSAIETHSINDRGCQDGEYESGLEKGSSASEKTYTNKCPIKEAFRSKGEKLLNC